MILLIVFAVLVVDIIVVISLVTFASIIADSEVHGVLVLVCPDFEYVAVALAQSAVPLCMSFCCLNMVSCCCCNVG